MTCKEIWCAGSILNYSGVSTLTPAEISQAAAHVLRFIDLGGHERYMKTALYGEPLSTLLFPHTCMDKASPAVDSTQGRGVGVCSVHSPVRQCARVLAPRCRHCSRDRAQHS